MPFGMDCTGFVKWAFINSGFDASLIPRSSQESSKWGDVYPEKISFSSNSNKINQLKPGDLLWRPGHIALVVAVSDTQIKIAQAVSAGITEALINKNNGNGINGGGNFEAYVLLDSFYQRYGN